MVGRVRSHPYIPLLSLSLSLSLFSLQKSFAGSPQTRSSESAVRMWWAHPPPPQPLVCLKINETYVLISVKNEIRLVESSPMNLCFLLVIAFPSFPSFPDISRSLSVHTRYVNDDVVKSFRDISCMHGNISRLFLSSMLTCPLASC